MLCVLMSFVIPFLVLPCMTRSIAEKGLKFHNRTLNKHEEFCFLVLEFYLHLFYATPNMDRTKQNCM